MYEAPVLPGSDAHREQMAEAIKKAKRVEIPRMALWNYEPCDHHDTPRPDCEYRACGGELYDHQTVTATWLVVRERALVASAPGTGKTNSALGSLCLLKEQGQVERAIFVVNSPAVRQWVSEARRFTHLRIEGISPGMPPKARKAVYARTDWDLLILSPNMLIKDVSILAKLGADYVLSDDVDALLNHNNRTHKAFCYLSERVSRVVVMNFSNLQTRLQELHAAMMPLGGRYIWGSLPLFERRYLLREWDEVRLANGTKVKVARTVGIQNGQELRDRLNKWVIRHTYEDLEADVKIPELAPPNNVWLDLYPKQREKYEELRKGVLKVQTSAGSEVRHVDALAMFNYGGRVCAGLAALGEPDGPGTSVKFDWLCARLQDSWTGRKVIVFARNLDTHRALQKRLDEMGIGWAVVWGDNNADEREAEVKRFWEDPSCQVFMGTSAIERSLNLQVANIVVNIDLHLNPERVKQILGRARRVGSAHSKVYVFNLLCRDTQEDGYIATLQRREALTSYVWDDDETVFEKLDAKALLSLIRP